MSFIWTIWLVVYFMAAGSIVWWILKAPTGAPKTNKGEVDNG